MPKRKARDNGIGHNSTGMIDGAALRRYVDRVIKLHEERATINEDIKVIYEEAKEAGFVTKQLRQIVREQMMEPDVLNEHLNQLDALRHALGQFASTALGEAAMERASA